MSKENASKNQLLRMPTYLYHLQMLKESGVEYVTAPKLARELDLNVELVKKDLALVSLDQGKPRVGRSIDVLITDMIAFLEYDQITEALLIGCGSLGSALADYQGWSNFGLKIVAIFDNDMKLIGTKINNLTVLPLERLEEIQAIYHAPIGIITVSKQAAQIIAERLVKAGCRALWNFAPVHLRVPKRIIVQDESMASSLAILNHRLRQ